MNTTCSEANSLQYLSEFKLLPIATPPNFINVLGCLCVTEFIAFYPNDSGSAMVYDNGFWEDDIKTELWSAWTSQQCVATQLENIDFSATSCVFNALILNVVTGDLYEVDESLAREFLYKHYVNSKRPRRT